MCYMCLSSNPFSPINGASPVKRKQERAAEIKKLIREAEDRGTCDYGDSVVEMLKREQYKLSREM